jgi:hypothetical protein
MLAADGCVQLEQPGVLLLRRLGPRRAGGRAVAMFGLSLVWHAHLPNSPGIGCADAVSA